MTTDQQYMRRALDLAQQGVGLVSPNPAVGALLVDASGREIGSGSHTYDGVKHAEVLAIEQVYDQTNDQAPGRAGAGSGNRARNATLYLNLEPCSHQGRTGPCADAIIAAGITRVVCSMEDPNPQVAGKGFAKLRAAGIKVEVGLCQTEARKLNEAFAKYILRKQPLVTLKSAMTLDGKIAAAKKPGSVDTSDPPSSEGARTGQQWITGELARSHVQQLRHQNDAILVGVGTVMADNPLLTDRSDRPRRRKLLRVILDSYLHIPPTSRVLETADNDVLIFCCDPDSRKMDDLKARGVSVAQVPPAAEGRPDFTAVLRHLGELSITSVIIEGGAQVNGAALASGEVDKVFLYYAPRILGGAAIPFSAGEDFGGKAKFVRKLELHRFGEDFAIEGYLLDPYQRP